MVSQYPSCTSAGIGCHYGTPFGLTLTCSEKSDYQKRRMYLMSNDGSTGEDLRSHVADHIGSRRDS